MSKDDILRATFGYWANFGILNSQRLCGDDKRNVFKSSTVVADVIRKVHRPAPHHFTVT